MKETIRTASLVEIYNSSIAELEKQKSELVQKLNLLSASNIVASIVSMILYVFLLAVTFIMFSIGLAAILSFFSSSERNADYNQTPIFLLFLIFGGIALWGLISYAKYRNEKKEMIEEEKHLLNQKIDEIIQQISDKEIRKKSLLTAEEVIVAKDLKVVKDITTTEKFSEETLSSELEKVCPMCAETIKKAAKVCRYCGYKF
jgi:hypothetical protein